MNADDADLLLEVRGLKTFFLVEGEDHRAVDGASFTIRRGEFMAIVGESGCGKSVAAYSILRLIQPPGRIAGGQILFHPKDGEVLDITALAEDSEALYRLRGGLVSMIFQEPMTALSPVHTVSNQICEAILLHQKGTPQEAEALALEMLRKVGIPGPEKRLKQYPYEMSGGMRQRAVIAMALACRPQLLIADEPTTALDVTIQAQILQLIKTLQRELGTSVLLITHDLAVVAQTADHVAVMYLGRIVEEAPARELLKSPRHPYTRALLKSLPGLARKGERLHSIPGVVPRLSEIPPGCPFHPRCPYYVSGTCDVGGPPELRECSSGRRVACVRAEEI